MVALHVLVLIRGCYVFVIFYLLFADQIEAKTYLETTQVRFTVYCIKNQTDAAQHYNPKV